MFLMQSRFSLMITGFNVLVALMIREGEKTRQTPFMCPTKSHINLQQKYKVSFFMPSGDYSKEVDKTGMKLGKQDI